MPLIHDDVFDQALSYISTTAVEAEVQTAGGSPLVNAITLTGGNFGSPANGSPSGREVECLVSDTSDMKNIAVSSAGSATKIALKDSAGTTTLIEADITGAPIALTGTDQVTLGTFKVTLLDPA